MSVYVDNKQALENHAVAQTALDVEQKVVRFAGSNRPGSTVSEVTPRTPGYSDTASQISSNKVGILRVEQSNLSLYPTIAESDIAEETPDLTEVAVQCKATSRKKYGEFLVKFGECISNVQISYLKNNYKRKIGYYTPFTLQAERPMVRSFTWWRNCLPGRRISTELFTPQAV